MKHFISLLTLTVVFTSSAQEYSLDLKMVSGDEEVNTVATIHLAKKPTKLFASFKNELSSEVFIVDSTQKKVLELIDEEDVKEAYLSSSVTTAQMEEPDFGLTLLYDMLSGEMGGSSDYRLLSDTKQFFGLTCRKAELLEDGAVVGTGWIAPGIHFGLAKNQGLFMTPDGMLIEMMLTGEEEGFRVECTGFSKGTVDNSQFSLTVPAGYELMDDTQE